MYVSSVVQSSKGHIRTHFMAIILGVLRKIGVVFNRIFVLGRPAYSASALYFITVISFYVFVSLATFGADETELNETLLYVGQ